MLTESKFLILVSVAIVKQNKTVLLWTNNYVGLVSVMIIMKFPPIYQLSKLIIFALQINDIGIILLVVF